MNKIKQNKILLLTIAITSGIVIFGVSTYAVGYVPLEPSVAGEGFNGDYGSYFQRIYQLGIAITGILAVLFIVIGGFEYMLSESVFDKGAGRDKITAAIGGLILALASWMILNTINPDLVKFDLSLPETTVTGGSTNNIINSSGVTYKWCRNVVFGEPTECFSSQEDCTGTTVVGSISTHGTCTRKIDTTAENIKPVGQVDIGAESGACTLSSCVSEQNAYYSKAYNDCPTGTTGDTCRATINSNKNKIPETCTEIIKSCSN